MTNERNEPGAYVRRVQEGNKAYAHDLLDEIERLRVVLAGVQAEKDGLLEKVRPLEECLAASDALRALVGSLHGENERLQEEAVRLRAEVERHQKEQERLLEQLDGIRAETEHYSSRYAEVEQQNSNLANLYVASYRLHGTLDREEVLATIREIVANLIGSEQMALFELRSDRDGLELLDSIGIDPEPYRRLPLHAGRIGAAARTGEIYVAEAAHTPAGAGPERGLTACVPLALDGNTFGVLAIFRLLPQKAGFEDVDRELFELLATHAATALYCTGLHRRLGREVAR